MDKKDVSSKFFEEEIYCHYTYIFRFANAAVQDLDVASDITQDIMETAWAKVDRLQSYELQSSALLTLAKNKIIDHQRKMGHRMDSVYLEKVDWLGQQEEDSLRDLLEQEDRFEILSLIAQLRDDHKRIILLYYFYDTSLKDVADLTGIAYNTVVSWHTRALRRMGYMVLVRQEKKRLVKFSEEVPL